MADEEEKQIQELKRSRTASKVQITSLCRQISTCNSSDKTRISDYYKKLQNTFSEFYDLHFQYAELVLSDDKYEQYRVVNALNLDDYIASVDKLYQEACGFYNDLMTKFLEHDINQAVKAAANFNESDRTAVNDHVTLCRELSVRFFALTCKSNEDLEQVIIKLQTSTRTQRTPDNNSPNASESVTAAENGAPSTRESVGAGSASGNQGLDMDPGNSSSVRVGLVSNANGNRNDSGGPNLSGNALPSSQTIRPQVSQAHITRSSPLLAMQEESSIRDFSIVSAYSDYEANVRAPVLGPSSDNVSRGSSYKYKKRDPPTFDGKSHNWPEFRSVWWAYAESEFSDNQQRAAALRQSLSGSALDCIRSVYSHQPKAYERQWQRLLDKFSDVSLCVQNVIDQLSKLKTVNSYNHQALVLFVDELESCYSQLAEINQTSAITVNQIDDLADKLPVTTRELWNIVYETLSTSQKVHPFASFMQFMEGKRKSVARLAERQDFKDRNKEPSNNSKPAIKLSQGQSNKEPSKCFHSESQPKDKTTNNVCLVDGSVDHLTEQCKTFNELSVDDRFEVVRAKGACFRCFGDHLARRCRNYKPCKTCNSRYHHSLICKPEWTNKPSVVANKAQANSNHINAGQGQEGSSSPSEETERGGLVSATDVDTVQSAESNHVSHARASGVLLPVQEVRVNQTNYKALLMHDSGSNSTFITHSAASRLNARRVGRQVTLDITTMGGREKEMKTCEYEIELVTSEGLVQVIRAYGLDQITGPIAIPDMKRVSNLFPGLDISRLVRSAIEVDILVGLDNPDVLPDRTVAKSVTGLRVVESMFGWLLQGPLVSVSNCSVSDIVGCHAIIHELDLVGDSQKRIDAALYAARTSVERVDSFIMGEELATEITPKCGGCKCSKCPVKGHSFSFREEQELSMIRNNLKYDPGDKCWVTKYPWVLDPKMLPDNYSAAAATLCNIERRLKKDPSWATAYHNQIEDMLHRNVARKLTEDELRDWTGPVFYLSHLAVSNPKSKSTPVRIVFNSSQVFKGFSLNGSLAKGPDSYLNNLLGVLLRWRERHVSVVADIRKMYNSVYIEPLEQHCHRFLWRDLDDQRKPEIYVITRVNMGDKPAGAISTEALYKTADMFAEEFPQVAEMLRSSTYVDDIVTSVCTKIEAEELAANTDDVLRQVGFQVKAWLCGGVTPGTDSVPEAVKVLGVSWSPADDTIFYSPTVNFSGKKRGTFVHPDLTIEQIPKELPLRMTRRMVLEQTMRLYDPFGILAPFVLTAKILLRQTWTLKLGWDDALPYDLRDKWVRFFTRMFQLSTIKFDRCLTPPDAVGKPSLILLSDGSDLAYGFAAYIHWQLRDGSYWSRLILAKCRIAPIHKLSTPQMELNGAVLAKRGRLVIEKELRLEFGKVYHLVDSETVLNMLNKLSTRFKLYEGVRIGEIQKATDGNMEDWWWISGSKNISDWVTRGKEPKEIDSLSDWWLGPEFLSKPPDEWGVKAYEHSESSLPGEKLVKVVSAHAHSKEMSSLIDFGRFSSAKKVVRVIALVRQWIKLLRQKKADANSKIGSLTPNDLHEAMDILVRLVQAPMEQELAQVKGKYRLLHPFMNDKGIWVVGSRMIRHNPFSSTLSSDPQVLLPNGHVFTRLLMMDAHRDSSHRGRDGTLSRFRCKFWTTKGSLLANRVKNVCQLCKVRAPQLTKQAMGQLPLSRLRPSPPFTEVMVDLFGPYPIKGEVQKRVTGKGYGVLFTDLFSRAVHIEGVFGYDTVSFLNALSRFVSVRGWPKNLYSDPGTQLVGACNEMRVIWEGISKDKLCQVGADNGLNWIFGPADSPWHQGAVESMVKNAKRCIHFAVVDHRFSASEFLTVCSQVSNMLNERPLGLLSQSDSDINVLTPNCLLLGRPIAAQPRATYGSASYRARMLAVDKALNDFWSKWVECYAPTMMKNSKWLKGDSRDLSVGDVVSVADSNALRGQYFVGRVVEVFPGVDGRVRRVCVEYKQFRVGSALRDCSGCKAVRIFRSVQRLALLVPIEGQ